MTTSIIDISRDFFTQIVKPILEKEFPTETKQIAFGIFGYGSEVLRMDDEYSRDHHWGRISPHSLYRRKQAAD